MSPEKHKSGGSSLIRSTFQRSISPSGKFCSSTISSSSSSAFTSPARSTSPSRITVARSGYGYGYGHVTSSPSVRFSIDHRHTSPNRSIAQNNKISNMTSSSRNVTSSSGNNNKVPWSYGSKKTCLCSPTTHPGSFRCSLHKNLNVRSNNSNVNGGGGGGGDSTVSYRSHRLHARRSAMTNSLVRIGTVEGDLVKRALAALIRPSSHQQRRRCDFQPRPSRLSVMSKAEE